MKELNHLMGKDYRETNSKEFQTFIAEILKKYGYSVETEVPVENRGDGRKGRIDIIAEIDSEIIAIEIDRNSPRKKSIYKVRNFNCDKRIIILRSPFKIIEIKD